jgi:hypothetical protein
MIRHDFKFPRSFREAFGAPYMEPLRDDFTFLEGRRGPVWPLAIAAILITLLVIFTIF